MNTPSASPDLACLVHRYRTIGDEPAELRPVTAKVGYVKSIRLMMSGCSCTERYAEAQ